MAICNISIWRSIQATTNLIRMQIVLILFYNTILWLIIALNPMVTIKRRPTKVAKPNISKNMMILLTSMLSLKRCLKRRAWLLNHLRPRKVKRLMPKLNRMTVCSRRPLRISTMILKPNNQPRRGMNQIPWVMIGAMKRPKISCSAMPMITPSMGVMLSTKTSPASKSSNMVQINISRPRGKMLEEGAYHSTG